MTVDDLTKHDIKQCMENDDGAWNKLFAATYPLACHKVKAYCPGIDRRQAEEIAQDTMLELSRQLSTVKHIKAFVTKVARNKCVDYLRKKNPADPSDWEAILDLIESLEKSPRSADDRTLLEELYAYLQSLHSPCNELLQERFFNEKSYKVIAKELDYTVNKVGVSLSRCLSKLKKELEERRNDLFYELKLYARAMDLI